MDKREIKDNERKTNKTNKKRLQWSQAAKQQVQSLLTHTKGSPEKNS